MDLFKSTFGDTQSYGTINDFTEGIVFGLQFLDKVLAKQRQDQIGGVITQENNDLQTVSNVFHNAAKVFEEAMEKDESFDVFSM